MTDVQPRNSCRSLVKQLRDSIRFMPIYALISYMNFTIKLKVFKQIHLYTILIQEKGNIFVDQMPTYLVFKKVHFMLA